MKQPYVSTLIEQDFSDEEKALARENISALSSADLGPYATKTWVSDNFLSEGDFRDFATHEEVASATSGKMDATESSAFYPRYSNPEGYLTSVPSTYATKQYVSSVAQGITSWAEGEFYPLSNPSHFITSADVPSGQSYTAGQYISIDQDNVITASGLQPELPVPTEASYLIGTATGSLSWKARNQWMYISNLVNHVITQTDLNNGYCDIPIDWSVPSSARVNNFSFCMDLSDMYAKRGSSTYIPLDTRVEKIKCSIWQNGDNTWYSNDIAHGSDPHGMVFEDILGSELSRVTSYFTLNKEVKRAGMTGPYYIGFSGPSFRIVFLQNNDLQVDDTIIMTGRISGINFEFGGW